MKKILLVILALVVVGAFAYQFKPVKKSVEIISSAIKTPDLVNKDSLTIQSRVNIPKGFKRVEYATGSFQEYLRNYELNLLVVRLLIMTTLNIFGKVDMLEC